MHENQSTRVREGDKEDARCGPSCVAGKGVGVVLIDDRLEQGYHQNLGGSDGPDNRPKIDSAGR
jgi:hypothetical protein